MYYTQLNNNQWNLADLLFCVLQRFDTMALAT